MIATATEVNQDTGHREKTSTSALKRAISLLDVRPSRVILAIITGVGAIGSAIALAAVSAWLIARASQMPPVLHLTVAVVAVRLFGITRGVLRYTERIASHDVALRGMARLREQVYNRLTSSRADRVVKLRRGDVLQRVGADVDAIGDVVVRAIIPTGVALVLGLASAGLMAYFLPEAGVILLLALVIAAVAGPALTLRANRQAEERGAQARADITAHSLLLAQESAELSVTQATQKVLADLQTAEDQHTIQLDAAARPAGWSAFVIEAAMGLAVIVSLVVGATALAAGRLEAVELAVIVLTPLAAFEPIQALPGAVTQWYRSRSAAQRLMTLLGDEEEPAVESPIASSPATSTTLPEPGDTGLVLSAQNLSVGWKTGQPVVHNFSLDIHRGQAIAITGPSGVGKTTLLLTLAGLLPRLAGDVQLIEPEENQHERRFIDPETIHDQTQRQRTVAVNLEDAHVFNTTVLENLRVARGDVTPEQARSVLKEVGLDEWLKNLPLRLNTVLGEDGNDISGGERRRLLLARALLTRAQLIMIDEPAEHLDQDAADELVTDLLRLAHSDKRAVIVVTHQHAPLDNADRILKL